MDLEIQAPDDATMQQAAQQIGAWRAPDPNTPGDKGGYLSGGISPAGDVWALNVYGAKMHATGNMIPSAMDPNVKVPEYVALPGVFAIARWNPASPSDNPPAPTIPGVTVVPLPVDSPMKWA